MFLFFNYFFNASFVFGARFNSELVIRGFCDNSTISLLVLLSLSVALWWEGDVEARMENTGLNGDLVSMNWPGHRSFSLRLVALQVRPLLPIGRQHGRDGRSYLLLFHSQSHHHIRHRTHHIFCLLKTLIGWRNVFSHYCAMYGRSVLLWTVAIVKELVPKIHSGGGNVVCAFFPDQTPTLDFINDGQPCCAHSPILRIERDARTILLVGYFGPRCPQKPTASCAFLPRLW